MKIPVLELLYNLLHRNDEKHQITPDYNEKRCMERQVIRPINKTTKVGHLDIQKVVLPFVDFFARTDGECNRSLKESRMSYLNRICNGCF